MKTLKTFLFLTITVIKSIAQVNSVMNNSSGTVNSIQLNVVNSTKYDVLSGSPYINPDFQAGKVMVLPVKWVDEPFLRLNTYTKVLEFKENGILKAANVKQIRGFVIGEKIYKSGFPVIEKQNQDSYYQVIYEGKYKILKFTNTVLEAVIAADDVKEGDKFTTYEYFYLLDNEKATRFFPTKKSILKSVSDDKVKSLETFLNSNGFKFKEDKDFASIGSFLDSLPK